MKQVMFFFFFSSRRRHTRFKCDWSSDVCSSDLDDVRVPSSCGFQGNSEAVGLHSVVRNTAETGHLARMRCEGKQMRFSFGQVFATAGEGVQAVSVEQERLLCFLDKRSYQALRFDLSSQTRPDGKQSFVFGKCAKAT